VNRIIREYTFASGTRLQLVEGDITQEHVDAIVNAANAYLKHGAGVAGAIIQQGGSQIQTESDAWVQKYGPVSHAKPAYTGGGRLACRYVIHAVGPVWGEGEDDAKLATAIFGALATAEELRLVSLSFPAISTGIFGFPKERAAQIYLAVVRSYIGQHPNTSLKQIRLTLFDQTTLEAFIKIWESQGLAGAGLME